MAAIYLPDHSRRHAHPLTTYWSTRLESTTSQWASREVLGRRGTHVGRLPDTGRVKHPLLTLRGRMACGAGARVPTAKVRHLDHPPVPAPSLLVVARLSRHAAPAVAEEAREPLA